MNERNHVCKKNMVTQFDCKKTPKQNKNKNKSKNPITDMESLFLPSFIPSRKSQ